MLSHVKLLFSIFSLLLLFLSFALFASAHNFGPSFEQEVGEYFIDVGYESDPLVAGESNTFALELYSKADRTPIDFNDIWVRMERGESTIYATGVSAGFMGQPTMIFTFPAAGEHTLYLRFQDDNGDEMVATSFPLTVVAGEGNQNLIVPIAVTAGIIIIAAVIFAFVGLRGLSKSKNSDIKEKN